MQYYEEHIQISILKEQLKPSRKLPLLGCVNVKDKNDGVSLPEADGEQSFCKGMWILESRKFWLWNSESGKKCLTVESGIQLKESVFPLKRWESRILGAVYMEGERSQYQEDARRRIILTPYVFCTCKGLYLSLALGSSQLTGRKILQHHVSCFRQEDPNTSDKPDINGAAAFSMANHGNKGQPFRLAFTTS